VLIVAALSGAVRIFAPLPRASLVIPGWIESVDMLRFISL